MPLHGHEISPSINPIEAGLKWACDFSKDFVGRRALEAAAAAGPERRLVVLDVTGRSPARRLRSRRDGERRNGERRNGERIVPGAKVGVCVAGMFCPSVRKYAANAFVRPEFSRPGTALAVTIRDKSRDALVVKRPLYLPAYRR